MSTLMRRLLCCREPVATVDRDILGRLLFEAMVAIDEKELKSAVFKTRDQLDEEIKSQLGFEIDLDCDPFGHVYMYDLWRRCRVPNTYVD
jgi:abortive infection bacteriophage resistance protein